MHVFAPAKINLSLRISGRRDDGYHGIETFVASISLADELTFERGGGRGEVQFECDDRSIPAGTDNLVVRAARAFFEIERSSRRANHASEENSAGGGIGRRQQRRCLGTDCLKRTLSNEAAA